MLAHYKLLFCSVEEIDTTPDANLLITFYGSSQTLLLVNTSATNSLGFIYLLCLLLRLRAASTNRRRSEELVSKPMTWRIQLCP